MAERPTTGLGSEWRRAREAKGVSLQHVAAVTKISVRALEAVERNDYSRLPGGIFMRAFVRAYATEIGLDPEAALRAFLAGCPPDVAAVPTSSPASIDGPSAERWYDRLPLTWMATTLAAVILLAGGSLYVYLGSERASHGAASASPEPSASAPTGVATSPAATASRPSIETPAPTPAPVPTAGPAPSAPAASGPVTVGLTATAPCWVSTAVDGRAANGHLFATGERALITVERTLVLKAGDAASLQLTINGQPGRPLGGSGQVVTVRIDAGNYRQFLAAP